MVTPATLASIRVLYRQPDTMGLWGIPYDMREGQSPRDLLPRHLSGDLTLRKPWHREDYTPPSPWIWLGSPGWWGHLTKEEQALISAFLAKHRENVPGSAHEWSTLTKET